MLKVALTAVVLCVMVGSARADEGAPAPVLVEMHEVSAAGFDGGTVAFGTGDGVVFAGADVGWRMRLLRGKVVAERLPGHPAQPHHKEARAVSLGDAGALVFLTDDRNDLVIARFDAKKGSWRVIDRPIGFVDRGHVVVGDRVYFPQSAASPGWFVYDGAADSFSRVMRPDDAAGCGGTAFSVGRTAAVAGEDGSGRACAVSYDPAKGAWRTLSVPPAPVGPLSVTADGRVYFLGSQTPTLLYEVGEDRWSSFPSAPWTGGEVVGTRAGATLWRIGRGKLEVATLDARAGAWTSMAETTDLDERLVARAADGSWWLAAKRRGNAVVVRLRHSPTSSVEELRANRAALVPAAAKPAPTDWKTASEAEKQAAITRGLGAVERYVPPVFDGAGKLKTKGAWVFALGEELVVWAVPPKSCRSFIEKLVAKWPTEPVGSTWRVERGAGFARAGKRMIYGPGAECEAALKCPADYFSERATPLSQVGPVFSYSVHTSQAVNCGEPVSVERWRAVDLRTQQAAEIGALIEEESIVEALRSHKATRKWVEGATNLAEAVAALRAQDPAAAGGFAFGGWRSMARRIELQLEFHPDSADHVVPIKLLVKPKEEFIQMFEEAAKAPGLLMSESN